MLLLERSLEDWERLLAGSCKFTLKKEGTLQTHQYIQKYLHEVGTYVQQHRGGRFVVRIGMGLVATLALFVTFFGMGAQGADASDWESRLATVRAGRFWRRTTVSPMLT